MGTVDRCICSSISFQEVRDIAEKKGYKTTKELQDAQVCCRHCKLCEPYISEMLVTGQTSFKPGELPLSRFKETRRV